jgi:hypothetical protein
MTWRNTVVKRNGNLSKLSSSFKAFSKDSQNVLDGKAKKVSGKKKRSKEEGKLEVARIWSFGNSISVHRFVNVARHYCHVSATLNFRNLCS